IPAARDVLLLSRLQRLERFDQPILLSRQLLRGLSRLIDRLGDFLPRLRLLLEAIPSLGPNSQAVITAAARTTTQVGRLDLAELLIRLGNEVIDITERG